MGTNFPDSPAETECNGDWIQIGGGEVSGFGSMMSVDGEPGWGDAQWAYDHGYNNGLDRNQYNWWLPDVPRITPFTAENRSWCVRYYRQFDDEFTTAGSDTEGADPPTCILHGTIRNKMLQSLHGAYVFQTQESDSGECRTNPSKSIVAGHGGGAPNGSLSPTITLDSCVDAPCRFELCVDGPLRDGGSITWRTKVTSLESGPGGAGFEGPNGGPEGSFTRTETAGAANGNWGGNINHSGGNEHTVGGSREAYFMGALWDDVDANRWIGPACEIEGGCP